MTELKNRGVQDNIFIACVDGLKGFPEAIEAVFPNTVQLCIVHRVRYSLNFVGWKIAQDGGGGSALPLHGSDGRGSGTAVDEVRYNMGRGPSIVQSWQRNWPRIVPFFDYPAEIRKVIYTTNAIESVNMSLRKVTKSRAHFPMTRP